MKEQHQAQRERSTARGRRRSRQWGSLAISAAVTAVALVLYAVNFIGERPTPEFSFLQRLELATVDLRFQLRGAARPDPRIIIVDIDQRAQQVLGRWPFPRSHFARMLDALREDGARVVAFDIIFHQPDETVRLLETLRQRVARVATPTLTAELERLETELDPDRQFAEALTRFGAAGGRVVLGTFFLYNEADLRGLDADALDRYAEWLAFYAVPQVRAADSARGAESYRALVERYADLHLQPRGALANLEAFSMAQPAEAVTTGYFNILSDPDGVVRRVPLVLPYGRSEDPARWDFYAALDLQAVRFLLGIEDSQFVVNYGATGIESLELGPERVFRPDELGRALIRYQGPAGTYPYVSIADVVAGNFPRGTFRDRLVLVGASATGVGDLRSTPFGTLDFPGVEIHANIADNLLHNRFLQRGVTQVLVDLSLIVLFGIPVGLWLAWVRPRWMALALLLLGPFALLQHWAFAADWWLNATTPALFTLVPNVVLVSIYRVLVEDRERRKVRSAFQHYLSPEVIELLLEDPALLEPRRTEITVLFSDIRGFTTLSEQLDPQELARLMNGYLTDMTQILFQHRGTLDKYIGDAVMAFWGAPSQEPQHAELACRAALEMQRRLAELRAQWQAEGKPPVEIGVGLNTGMAAVGNMGSELRYGYTAMGDTVNLASRLEALNREFGTAILLSEATAAALPADRFLLREVDHIRVKGKRQPVLVFELLALVPEDRRAQTPELDALRALAVEFAAARALYRQRRWAEAKAAFEAILARWPADGPARVFLRRCATYLAAEPPPDWDGVFAMQHK
ncbi:MAG: adenylate/guanylate cyclase domain-containing protein [Firmicutes bacterium]|nr:adenylate/guanylate cyclase domain-containing protein [Bacillota bacterium]